jgi:hypothetical protein
MAAETTALPPSIVAGAIWIRETKDNKLDV